MNIDNIIFFIKMLFFCYIKRPPNDYELNIHINKFISVEKSVAEFSNCYECKLNINKKYVDFLNINNNDIDNKKLFIKYFFICFMFNINNIDNYYDELIYKYNNNIILFAENNAIYKYNIESLIIDNDENFLNDILIRYHENYNIENKFISWNPIIAVKNNNILRNSNSYLLEYEIKRYYDTEYEKYYKIYENININYNKIKNNIYDYIIEEKCIYLGNAFIDSNIGHCLSFIFFIINKYDYIDKNIKFVITNNIIDNALKILLTLIDKNQILMIDEKKIYKFKNIMIYNINFESILSIEKYNNIINKILLSNSISFYKNKNLENKKVFLVKEQTNNKKGCVGFVMNDRIKNFLNENNIFYTNSKDINIYELIYILQNAEIIITSPGTISYAHMIFFNKNAKLYFIGKKYYYSYILNFTYISHLDIATLQNIFI